MRSKILLAAGAAFVVSTLVSAPFVASAQPSVAEIKKDGEKKDPAAADAALAKSNAKDAKKQAKVMAPKEGTILDCPDSGACFRCDPDGSNAELVAIGLRNPQSLCFNDYGDLFNGDNNADGGDKVVSLQDRLAQCASGFDRRCRCSGGGFGKHRTEHGQVDPGHCGQHTRPRQELTSRQTGHTHPPAPKIKWSWIVLGQR